MSCVIPSQHLISVLKQNLQADFQRFKEFKNTLASVLTLYGVDAEARLHACLGYFTIYQELKASNPAFTLNGLEKTMERLEDASNQPLVNFEALLEELAESISKKTKAAVRVPIGNQQSQLVDQATVLAETATDERQLIAFLDKVDRIPQLDVEETTAGKNLIYSQLREGIRQNQDLIPEAKEMILRRIGTPAEVGLTSGFQVLSQIDTLQTQLITRADGTMVEVKPEAIATQDKQDYPGEVATRTYNLVNALGRVTGETITTPAISIYDPAKLRLMERATPQLAENPRPFVNEERDRSGNNGINYQFLFSEISQGTTLKNHHNDALKEYMLEVQGGRPADSVRLKASRRKVAINQQRLDRLQGIPGMENRSLLTHETVKQEQHLQGKRASAVVTSFDKVEGVTFHLTDDNGQYLTEVEFVDRFALVYPDNTTVAIDFENPDHQRQLKELVSVRYQRGTTEYVQPFTDEHLQRLIVQQKALRAFQAEIAPYLESQDEEIDIPRELFTKHFTLQHILSTTHMGSSNTAYSVEEYLRRYDNAAVEVEIITFNEAYEPISQGVRRLPIVYNLKQNKAFGLVSPLAADEYVRTPEGNYRWEEYVNNVLQVQMPTSEFKGGTHVLMTKRATGNGYVPVKLLSYENPVNKQHYMPFFGAISRLRQMTTLELQAFNRDVWGFPIVKNVKPWFKAVSDGTYRIDFTPVQKLTPDQGNFIAPETLHKLGFGFKAPELQQAQTLIANYFSGRKKLTAEALEALFVEEVQQKQPAALEVLSAIQSAESALRQTLGSEFNKRFVELGLPESLKHLLTDPDGLKLRKNAGRNQGTNALQVMNDKKDSYPSLAFNRVTPAPLHALPAPKTAPEVAPTSVQRPVVLSAPTNAPQVAPEVAPDMPAAIQRKNVNRSKAIKKQDFDFQLGSTASSGMTTEAFNAEVDYIRSILPEGIQIDDLGKIIKDLEVDGSVLGAIKDRVIYLSQSLSQSGTAHHEAFHAVFQYLLEPAQQRELLDAQLKRRGRISQGERNSFRQARGLYALSESEINDKILEEALADGFRDYVQGNQPVTKSVLNRFFEFLKKLLGMFAAHGNVIDEMYRRIDQGYYANASLRTLKGDTTFALVSGVPYISGVDEEGFSEFGQRSLGVSEMILLKNRMVHELLLRSASESTASELYDEIAGDLRKEFTMDNLLASHPKAGSMTDYEQQAVARKYERSYTNIRYALGSARFDNEPVTIIDDTGTYTAEVYAADEEIGDEGTIAQMNEVSYNQLKNDILNVYNDYSKVTLDDQLNDQDVLDDADKDESEESSMGESYRDGSMLESLPSEGGTYFRRIFKFQMYSYTDPQLGVTYNRMVDGDALYDTLHRILGNVPKAELIETLYATIDRLENDYKQSQRINRILREIPADMVKTDELLQSLRSVTQLLERMCGVTRTQPVAVKNIDFYNQFSNVFYTAAPMVQLVGSRTKTAEKRAQGSQGPMAPEDMEESQTNTPVATFENSFYFSDNIQYSDNRELVNDLQKRLRNTLETMEEGKRLEIGNLLEQHTRTMENMIAFQITKVKVAPGVVSQKVKPGANPFFDPNTPPFSSALLQDMVDQVYSLLSMANLGIPRHAVYFSIMAMYESGHNRLPRDSQEYADFKANEKFFYRGQFLTPYLFKQIHQLLRGKGSDDLAKAYAQAGPYLSAYDPTLGSAVITNAEGKKISRYVSYTPSLLAIQDINTNGLNAYLHNQFKGTLDEWFKYNPMLAELSPQAREKILTDDKADKTQLLYQDFIRQMEVGVFNGFEHTSISGEKEASSFGGLDNRSYLLSLLAMFADRRAIHGSNTGLEGQVFFRPITQFESTSTAFTVSSFYEEYYANGKNNIVFSKYFQTRDKATNELVPGGTSRITERLADIVNQEFHRIQNEYNTRNDAGKLLFNGYNAIQGKNEGDAPQTDLTGLNAKGAPILRAYHFNYLQDFFGYISPLKQAPLQPEMTDPRTLAESDRAAVDEATLKANQEIWEKYDHDLKAWQIIEKRRAIRDALQKAALEGKTFESLNTVNLTPEGGSVMRELFLQLVQYSNESYQKFEDFATANKILDAAGASYIGPQTIKLQSAEAPQYIKLAAKNQSPKDFLRDFHHNFWVNSLLINQVFDGDFAQGIGSFVNYFKRQKSGAAAGANAMSASELSKGSSARTTFRVATINELHVWLDDADLLRQQTDEETLIEAFGTKKRVEVFDGQSFGTIDFRMMVAEAQGYLDEPSREYLKKLRYDRLDPKELEYLNDRGILLNSLKTVTASPQDYHKLSVHTVQRRDVSVPKKGTTLEQLKDLYDQADRKKADMHQNVEGAKEEYQSIMREIHGLFDAIPGREILHNMINAMEYHDVDQLMDETASKRVSRLPLRMKMANLENTEADYLNLEESVIDVDRNYLFNQVSTSAMHDDTTNGIQQLLLTDADMFFDPTAKPGQKGYMPADLHQSVLDYRQNLRNVATANLERIKRLMLTNDGKLQIGLLYESMEKALLDRGASANELAYLKRNPDGTPVHSPSMPNTAKMIEYYFFSLFNKAMFAPKIAGKKFFHVSSMGYKVVVDKQTGAVIPQSQLQESPATYRNKELYETRYPGVIKETTSEGKTQYVVEVIVPRAIAGTEAEREQIEAIEKEFFGTRIPTEDKRSMVVARVVDYIDASYYNSIIVPYQVHLWSGSDMDIDSLYAQTKASYKSVGGRIIEYGDYSSYVERLKISESQAKFLEYLRYMESDPLIKSHLRQSRQTIKELQGEDLQKVLVSVSRMTGLTLGSLADMTAKEFNEALKSEDTKGYLKRNHRILLDSLIVMEALNRAGMPTTVDELEQFEHATGTSPVLPLVQNRILKARMDILKHPHVYENFLSNERSNADAFDSAVKSLGLSESEIVNSNNAFAAMGVLTARDLNASSKDGIGITASVNKGVSLLVKADVRLIEPVWNLYDSEGNPVKDPETGEPIVYDAYNNTQSRAHGLIGNTLGMFADAAKRPYPSPLKINKYNTPAMNTMFAVGLPEEMSIAIHSVKLLQGIIQDYAENYESVYKDPSIKKVSFNKHLTNQLKARQEELSDLINQYGGFKIGDRVANELSSLEQMTAGHAYYDHTQFKISFDPNQMAHNKSVHGLGFTVRSSKNEIVPDELAEYVLAERFAAEVAVANEVSFTVTRLTDAQRSLKPDFKTFDSVRDAYKKAKSSQVFTGLDRVFRENPVYTQLEAGLDLVNGIGNKLFLKRQPAFRELTRTLSSILPGVEEAELTNHITTYFMISRFTREYQQLFSDKEAFASTTGLRKRIALSLDKMRQASYWTQIQAEGSLVNTFVSLREEFSDNAFIGALELKNSLSETTMALLQVKPGLSNELTENVVDGFTILLQHPDEEVAQKATDLFVYAVLKDGLITQGRKGTLLKVFPAELMKSFSRNLQRLESVFNEPIRSSNLQQANYHFKESLSEYLFSEVDSMENAITELLRKVVAGYKNQPNEGEVKLLNPRNQKFSEIKPEQFKSYIHEIVGPDKYKTLINKVGQLAMIPGTRDERKGIDPFIPIEGLREVVLYTEGANAGNPAKELLLAHLGIRREYSSGKEGTVYSFPMIKFNKNGQMLLLHRIDGQTIGEGILQRMTAKNMSSTELQDQDLTVGKTATYRVMEVGGTPDILPYGFSAVEAAKLYKAYGEPVQDKSITSRSKKTKSEPQERSAPQLTPNDLRRLTQQVQQQLSYQEEQSTSCNFPS